MNRLSVEVIKYEFDDFHKIDGVRHNLGLNSLMFIASFAQKDGVVMCLC